MKNISNARCFSHDSACQAVSSNNLYVNKINVSKNKSGLADGIVSVVPSAEKLTTHYERPQPRVEVALTKDSFLLQGKGLKPVKCPEEGLVEYQSGLMDLYEEVILPNDYDPAELVPPEKSLTDKTDPPGKMPLLDGIVERDSVELTKPLIDILRNMIVRTLNTTFYQLLSRFAGIEVFYLELRILWQSHDPLPQRLIGLKNYLKTQLNNTPEEYLPLMRYSLSLIGVALQLWTLFKSEQGDQLADIVRMIDKFSALLKTDDAHNLMAKESLSQFDSNLQEYRKLLIFFQALQTRPSGSSPDSWLQLLKQHNLLPDSLNGLLEAYFSLQAQARMIVNTTQGASGHHPWPNDGNWQQHINWLSGVMQDDNIRKRLMAGLCPSFQRVIQSAMPLLKMSGQYPVDMPAREQLSWLVEYMTSNAAEFRPLLPCLPVEHFLDNLREKMSSQAVNTRLVLALLELCQPSRSIWQNSVNIVSLFMDYSGQELPGRAVRAGITYWLPGGRLLLNGWDWYQSLSPDLSWQEMLHALQQKIVANLNDPSLVRAVMPEGLLKVVDSLAIFTRFPQGRTWQETMKWAAKCMNYEKEFAWLAQRYFEVSLIWGFYETLQLAEGAEQKRNLQNFADIIADYMDVQVGSVIRYLLDILPSVPLLASLYQEIRTLSARENWLSWASGLLCILEKKESPELVCLRNQLENQIINTLSEGLIVGLDILCSAMPEIRDPFTFPGAQAVMPLKNHGTEFWQTITVGDSAVDQADKEHQPAVALDAPHKDNPAVRTTFDGYVKEAEYWRNLTFLSGAGSLLSAMIALGIRYAKNKARSTNIENSRQAEEMETTSFVTIKEESETSESEAGTRLLHQGKTLAPQLTSASLIGKLKDNPLESSFWVLGLGLTLPAAASMVKWQWGKQKTEQYLQNKELSQIWLEVTPDIAGETLPASEGDLQEISLSDVRAIAEEFDRNKHRKRTQRAATTDAVAPYLDNVICQRWNANQAYPLSADQIKNLVQENNLWNLNGEKFLKASNGYWLVRERLGDIEPYTLINDTGNEHIRIFIGKEGTWTTIWHAELIHQGEAFFDILTDWRKFPININKTLKEEIAYIIQSNEILSIKIFLEQFDQIIRLLILKNSDDLESAAWFMMARSELLDKFYYNSFVMSEKYKVSSAKLMPGAVKLQMLFSEEVKDEELYLEAIRAVEGRETQLKKTQDYIEVQKSLLAREKYPIAHDEWQSAISESEIILNKLKEQGRILKEAYQEGIKKAIYVSKYYLFYPYSAAKTKEQFDLYYYNYVMNEGKSLYEKNYSAEQMVLESEKYKGARKYLKWLFNLQLTGEKMMDHLPEDMYMLAHPNKAWYIAWHRNKNKDYRVNIAAEELAKNIYESWTDAEIELKCEGDIALLSAIILFRIRNCYNAKPTQFSAKEVLDNYLDEKLKRDPLALQDCPPGYYSLNNFKARKTYNTQNEFSEQFNVYLDKYLAYDVRVLSKNLLVNTGIHRLDAFLPVSKQHLFRIVNFIGEKREHYGNVLSMQTNDGWFIIFEVDGTLNAEFFSEKKGTLALLPEVFINPQAKLGSLDEHPEGPPTDEGYLFQPLPTTNIYYPAKKTKITEKSEFKDFWEWIGYKIFSTPQLVIVDNDSNYSGEDKSVVSNVLKFVENSIRTTVNNARSQLDETGIWHKIAICLIPFYEVIYKAATDRKYSPSAEDIVSIVTDIITTLTIIVDAGVKISQLTSKTIDKIAAKAGGMMLSGFSKREIIFQVALLTVKEMGTKLLPSVIKILSVSLIELINPVPFINISDVASYTYKYSLRMIDRMTKSANSGLFSPILTGQKINLDPSDAIDIDPAELSLSGELKHANKPGKIYEKKNVVGSDSGYFINDDKKIYRVNWDADADSWRLMLLAGSESHRRGPRVMFSEEQWFIYPEISAIEGQYVSRKLTPGLRNILVHGNSCLLTQSYDENLKIFLHNDTYTLSRLGTADENRHGLSTFSAQLAGEEMQKIGKNLLDYAENYTGAGKEILIDSLIRQLNDSETLVKNIFQGLAESSIYNESGWYHYALVTKGAEDNFLSEQVYGFLCLSSKLNTDSVEIKYLFSHPYIIANNFTGFRDYLLQNNLVSAETLNKYHLRLTDSHLLSAGLLKTIDDIETDYGVVINDIRLPKQDASTEPLIVALQKNSDYSSRLQDIVSRTTLTWHKNELQRSGKADISGLIPGEPSLKSLKPVPVPVYLEEYDLAVKRDHFLAQEGYKIGAENLDAAMRSSLGEYRNFAQEVRSSADKVCQMYIDIRDILLLSKENQEIKDNIKTFLSLATGLNTKNSTYDVKYQDLTPTAAIADLLFERFEDKIKRGFDYMIKQRNANYSNFVIVDETGTPDIISGKIELKNKIYGFVLPGDKERKIYLTLPPEWPEHTDLTLDILHESTHAAAETSDLAYPGYQRFSHNRFKSIYDQHYRSDKIFFANLKNEKLVTSYILNIDNHKMVTDDKIAEAKKYFINNKLVRADLLFHEAEFNTRLINHFNETYKLDETRTNIEQDQFLLSSCFPTVKRELEIQSRKVRGSGDECASTSRLGNISINDHSYIFTNFDEVLFFDCFNKNKEIKNMKTDTLMQSSMVRFYLEGRLDYLNAMYSRFDKLTPNQKMELYLSVDGCTNHERGALYPKIQKDFLNFKNYNIARNSKVWNKRASRMGAYKVNLFSHDIFLSRIPKESISEAIIVSWAIENNMESQIANRLYSLTLEKDIANTSLYNDMVYLREKGRTLEFYNIDESQLIDAKDLIESEARIFKNNVRSIYMSAAENSMSITIRDNDGIRTYAFYDPRFGISYFKRYEQLCNFISLQLHRDPEYSGKQLILRPLDFSASETIEINGKNIRQVVAGEQPVSSLPYTNSIVSISTDFDGRGPFTYLGLSLPDIALDISDVKFQNNPYIRTAYSRFTESTTAILDETRHNMDKLNSEKNQHKKEKAARSMKFTEANLNRYAAHAGILITDGKKQIAYKDEFLNIVLTPKQRDQFPGQEKLGIQEAKFPQKYSSKNKSVRINLEQPPVKAKYYKIKNSDSFIEGIKEYYLKTDENNPLHPLLEKRIKDHIVRNKYLLPFTSGIPGFHAEIQAFNYSLNMASRAGEKVDKVLNQTYIFTQRLTNRLRGNDFKACHNCAGVLSGLENVMTGKVSNQEMFTYRRTDR